MYIYTIVYILLYINYCIYIYKCILLHLYIEVLHAFPFPKFTRKIGKATCLGNSFPFVFFISGSQLSASQLFPASLLLRISLLACFSAFSCFSASWLLCFFGFLLFCCFVSLPLCLSAPNLSALCLRVYIKEVCTHISENEKITSLPCTCACVLVYVYWYL